MAANKLELRELLLTGPVLDTIRSVLGGWNTTMLKLAMVVSYKLLGFRLLDGWLNRTLLKSPS